MLSSLYKLLDSVKKHDQVIIFTIRQLRSAKSTHIQWCQKWTNRRLYSFFRLTFYNRRWAYWPWAWCRGGALCGFGAFYNRATGARAGWAFSRITLTLAIIYDNGLGLRNTAF